MSHPSKEGWRIGGRWLLVRSYGDRRGQREEGEARARKSGTGYRVRLLTNLLKFNSASDAKQGWLFTVINLDTVIHTVLSSLLCTKTIRQIRKSHKSGLLLLSSSPLDLPPCSQSPPPPWRRGSPSCCPSTCRTWWHSPPPTWAGTCQKSGP